MSYEEFDISTTYMIGNVVWYGELAYVCVPHNCIYQGIAYPSAYLTGEIPEDSKGWRVYWRSI